MSIWYIALTFFLVANPIGNAPAFVALVKDFDFKHQQKILFREAIFSYLLAIIFLLVGERFLHLLQIKAYAVSVSGGTILLLVAMDMMFPPKGHQERESAPKEPFIVPIATPLITGGGVLSTILIYSARVHNDFIIFLACTIAWIGVTIIVVSSAYLNRALGRRGLLALEQVMGMILTMISVEIIVKGVVQFMQELS